MSMQNVPKIPKIALRKSRDEACHMIFKISILMSILVSDLCKISFISRLNLRSRLSRSQNLVETPLRGVGTLPPPAQLEAWLTLGIHGFGSKFRNFNASRPVQLVLWDSGGNRIGSGLFVCIITMFFCLLPSRVLRINSCNS